MLFETRFQVYFFNGTYSSMFSLSGLYSFLLSIAMYFYCTEFYLGCRLEQAMVNVELGLKGASARSLRVQLQPVFLFVEDRFLFAVHQYATSFAAGTALHRLHRGHAHQQNRSGPFAVQPLRTSLSAKRNLT